MSTALLALAPVATWGIVEWFVFIIIIAAVCGITYSVLQYFGVAIPPIFLRILGIVLVAAFAIIAIRFLLSL